MLSQGFDLVVLIGSNIFPSSNEVELRTWFSLALAV